MALIASRSDDGASGNYPPSRSYSGADMADFARRHQRMLVRGYKGKEADRLVTRIDPGVVSMVAELRGHGRRAAEELGQWETITSAMHARYRAVRKFLSETPSQISKSMKLWGAKRSRRRLRHRDHPHHPNPRCRRI